MSTAKEDILISIRRAIGGTSDTCAETYAALPRGYRRSIGAEAAGRIDLFVDRLRDYDAIVYRCEERGIADAIAGALNARGKKQMLIPRSLSQPWLPQGFAFVAGDGLAYEDLDRSEGVLTGCALAIAMTGTILLKHPDAQGPRALTLIPDYHLCVVFANQVVGTVPEGIRQIHESGGQVITTVSGPSATADIEMTRVKGVHGPRDLDVILVE